MATETSARAEPSHRDELQERDYQAFFTTLSTSARGRAFLAEYARRNRNADTELLVAAIDKLQTLAAANKEPAKADPARSQLHALLDEIIAARSELDANILTMQAAKLTDLIVMAERRIGTIIASLPAERVIEVESVSSDESEMQPEKTERTYLAVVPPPDQPELPIPSPITAPQPSIELVRSDAMMAEISFADPPPSHGGDQARVVEMPVLEPAPAPGFEPAPATTPTVSANDPLASINALSEAERLALFT